jgi:hypothetical protein
MMTQDPPTPNSPLHTSLLDALKQDKVMEGAIAEAISDRIFQKAQELGEDARKKMESVDWTEEIMRAVEDKGVSDELVKGFGGFGDCVKLRIQISLVEYQREIQSIRNETEQTLKIEQEAKKVELEKRWTIRRNAQLTRIEWSLSIFSLWPVIALISISMIVGAGIGIYYYRESYSCTARSSN